MQENFTTEENKEISAEFIKCENCGANMVFNPETQTLYCESCSSTKDFEKDRQVQELAIAEAFAKDEIYDNESAVYSCENCGANVVVNADEVSSKCPFCDTPFVVKNSNLRGIKPNAIFPFTIGKEKALHLAKANIKKRLFCPSKFKKSLTEESVKGMYVPCFTFDSNTISVYNGRVGETRTRTVRTRNGTRTETYVVWKNISGTIGKAFDDITVATSSILSQKALNKLMPFDYNTIAVYDKSYLSGFFANHYEKDVKTSWEEAKEQMSAIIRRSILSQYNCDKVDYLNVSTTYNETTYKYILMPVYYISYKYKKKLYTMYINGNTGKVYGKMPVSPWRVLIATILGVGAVALLGWLIYTNLL